MSNETKRDVFETFADKCAGYDDGLYEQYLRQYDAALPDDMPVIPKAVGEYIKNLWKYHRDLVDVFGMVRDLGVTRTDSTWPLVWVAHNTDTFARAWLLGVWRVEETGELVKLEEIK